MISSLLSELRDLDGGSLSRRLYNSRAARHHLSTSTSLIQVVDKMIATLSDRHCDRGAVFQLLTIEMNDPQKSLEIESRVASLIDRLPALCEASASSEGTTKSYLDFLHSMLDCASDELISKINRILPKLAATASRLCDEDITSAHGLAALQVLLQSRSRMIIAPSGIVIRKACLRLLEHPTGHCQLAAATVMAMQASLETAEGWATVFVGMTAECIRLLHILGVTVTTNADKKAIQGMTPLLQSLSMNDTSFTKLWGLKKASAIEKALCGCCAVIEQMLAIGCSSGDVPIELTFLLPLIAGTLSFNIDVSISDPKNSIESEFGVSPIDLMVVMADIKIHVLGVLNALLQIQNRSLLRVCSALCRPIGAVLGSTDGRKLSRLSRAALATLSSAARCFPTALAREAKVGINALLEFFQREMTILTQSRSSVLVSDHADGVMAGVTDDRGNSTGSRSGPTATPAGTEAVFSAVETLLLYSGNVLPTEIRDALEYIVGQGLACLCKGVLPPLQYDRRVRRTPCERLREQPVTQISLLRVAVAEVLSSSKDGIVSGNVALLRHVCGLLLLQPATSAEAAKGLLAVESLMFPASVVLPTAPPDVLVNKMLAARARVGSGISAASDVTGQTNAVVVDTHVAGVKRVNDDDTTVTGGPSKKLATDALAASAKRDEKTANDENEVEGEEDEVDGEDESEAELEDDKAVKGEVAVTTSNTKFGAKFGSAFGGDDDKGKGGDSGDDDGDDDDDDDDSLPDIDIDAEPDQN